MIGFFSVATVLLLAALALLVHPLLRKRDDGPEDHAVDAVALGRERLAELKRRRAGGDISEAEYTAQVDDLETQLADDLGSQQSTGTEPTRRGGQWIGIVVVIFIPVLSGLLYLALGKPQALIPEARVAAGPAADPSMPADIDAMVARLAQRLEENPDDAEGWFMLGRSYMVLNRYGEAADAFARLREVAGDSPDVLVSHATAMAMASNGDMSGEPRRLVQEALAQQPDHAQALWLAATAAYQAGDYDTALDYYRRAEPLLDGEPLQQVRDMIAELVAQGYGQSDDQSDGASDGQGNGQVDETGSSPDASASLEVSVSLSPNLGASAGEQDTVFIFVKAVDGPPMPLAVVKRTVADLPVTVTLDDSQAMTPQLKLSGFERVTVGARVSSSGQAGARPGDLEGESPPVSTGTDRTIHLTIDRVVPGE